MHDLCLSFQLFKEIPVSIAKQILVRKKYFNIFSMLWEIYCLNRRMSFWVPNLYLNFNKKNSIRRTNKGVIPIVTSYSNVTLDVYTLGDFCRQWLPYCHFVLLKGWFIIIIIQLSLLFVKKKQIQLKLLS